MERRKFIQRVTYGVGAMGVAAAKTMKTLTWRIDGFSCATCAVGLDTMLKDKKGIVRSKSSYSDRTAVIEYNPELVNETEIRAFIQELGFTAFAAT